ncbi:GNAT family N-acetyltransferase [Dactylosporangium sp. CS-033363]|uniref:GNAT family N-acetyltransferase n=1 Tax=Dactylosporangium sp. CS-033363 TaxID=3239935 RepID=UPI003D93D4B9
MGELRTERLLLRAWRDADLAPWAAMNADPAVREFLGRPLTLSESAASIEYFQTALDRDGFGFWAVEVAATGEFIGFTGLDAVDDGLPFTGIEAGWRLARGAWGHGYATEAARAVLDFGFGELALPEILAVTARGNVRSQAVMRRLGMSTDPADDFDDPGAGLPHLRASVLHRKQRPGPAA